MMSYVRFMHSAVLFIAVFTLVASRRGRQELYAEHYRKVSEFQCLEPQPRMIPATELSHVLAGPDKIVVPHASVLHRCAEDCGFCHSNKRCVPALDEEVVLVFSVTRLEGKAAKVAVKATNHTLCGCEEYQQDKIHSAHIPKC